MAQQPGNVLNTAARRQAFGTGYRIQAGEDSPQAPRNVALVSWRLNLEPVNTESTIRDAPFDSNLRNVFDPSEPG